MKNKLYFSYGGFRGPNYEIKYKDKRFYISLGEMSSQSVFDVSYPNKKRWDNFWLFVNNRNIWLWKKEYFNKNILDGIQWEIKLSDSSNKVKSYGSNMFPNQEIFKSLISEFGVLFDFDFKELQKDFDRFVKDISF